MILALWWEMAMLERAREALLRAERIQQRFMEAAALAHGTGPSCAPSWGPLVNVLETADAVHVMAALPGLGPSDVEVGLERRELILTGRRDLPEAYAGADFHALEVPFGRFQRRLALPVDGLALEEVRFDRGMLHLTLRKRS